MATPITPETRVHLLSVPLENNMKATLWFSSLENQTNYFLSKAIKSNTDFTYQRKDKSMVVPYLVDTIYSCNYVMYQNHNFNNKWFYAFITKMEYVDEETSRLYIETDPIQTWWFDITFKDSFIEREHTDNDIVGTNVEPENLELGEFICNRDYTLDFHNTYRPCLAVTEYPSDDAVIGNTPIDHYKTYGGIFSGVGYIVGEDDTGLSNIIRTYDKKGKADAIIGVFMIPESYCQNLTYITCAGYSWTCKYAVIEGAQDGTALSFNKPITVDSYTPHNKKLLTFPFIFMNLDNNAGVDVTLHFEDFTTSTCTFELDSNICPGISGKITPSNYKIYRGIDNNNEPIPKPNYEYSIPLAKLPICSWNSDSYVNYMTQNSLNIGLNVLAGAGYLAGAIATGGTLALVGATLGGNSILSALSEVYKASLIPDQAKGNTNNTDINFTLGLCNPKLYYYSIKYGKAIIIDEYFDMFGYKTDRVKTPNYNHRKNYWYTKTIDANIVGDIPEEDMEKIKACYNNGITFWKNPANMYDYSVDNSII